MIPVDLNDIVKETIYFLESHLIKSAIELQMKLSPEIPKVIADPSQLYQVLVNLVVNAIQSMDRGGILKIETIPSGEFVRLSVEDNGYGMSEDVVGKIFIPFFTTKKDGTGLGLSVVHGIVESHGGKIEVKSIEKKGTVFSVMLPAEKSEENKNA
jgi:signal transduction histidine kinase